MAALLAVIIVRLPHHHWSWPLFIWGAAIGLLIVPANLIVTTMVLRVLPLSEQTHSALLTRLRVRERSFYLPLVLGSLCFAAVSAARDSPVPDVIETACFAVAVGVPLWLLPKLRRGIARGRTY